MSARISEKNTPSPRVYEIDLARCETYEAAALLLTLLAFPDETRDETVLQRLHCSLCTAALGSQIDADPDWVNGYHVVRPIHFSVPRTQVRKDLRRYDRLMRDRMVAGRMANAIIFDAAGLNPKLPKGCHGFSIQQLIKLALDDAEQLEGKNVEQRIWRPSLPVIHFAAAVQAYFNRSDATDGDRRLGHLIFDPQALRWILERAAETRKLMSDFPDRFGTSKKPEVLIRLRTEKSQNNDFREVSAAESA